MAGFAQIAQSESCLFPPCCRAPRAPAARNGPLSQSDSDGDFSASRSQWRWRWWGSNDCRAESWAPTTGRDCITDAWILALGNFYINVPSRQTLAAFQCVSLPSDDPPYIKVPPAAGAFRFSRKYYVCFRPRSDSAEIVLESRRSRRRLVFPPARGWFIL